MLPSILTFYLKLILGTFLTFWGSNGLIGKVQKRFFFLSAGIAKQLLFSTVSSSLSLEFDLIFGKCWLLGAPMGYFLGRGKVQKHLLGLNI